MKFKIVTVLLLFSISVWSQEEEPSFDRPGIADGPFIVKKHSHQFELGFAFSDQYKFTSSLNPNVMYRTAFFKRQELRITYNYLPQYFGVMHFFDTIPTSSFAIGIKQKMCKEQSFLPELALGFNYFNKLGVFKRNSLEKVHFFETNILALHNFSEKWNINYNLGLTMNNSKIKHYYNYSVCLTFSPTDKIDLFVENFAYIKSKAPSMEMGCDGGILFHHKNYQFDLSYVVNFLNNVHYGNVLVGVSINLD